MANQYRVWMHIAGGMGRPPYDGYVDVYAADDVAAEDAARNRLKQTSFPDVWKSSMHVKRVERQR